MASDFLKLILHSVLPTIVEVAPTYVIHLRRVRKTLVMAAASVLSWSVDGSMTSFWSPSNGYRSMMRQATELRCTMSSSGR